MGFRLLSRLAMRQYCDTYSVRPSILSMQIMCPFYGYEGAASFLFEVPLRARECRFRGW